MAVSWAEVLGAEKVYIGAVEQDSSGYPDCRPEYYQAFNQVVKAGTKDGRIQIVTPLIGMRKFEIVRLGLELGAPFDLTWSCYTSEDRACGVCDSCVLRLRAFREAGAVGSDPVRGSGKFSVTSAVSSISNCRFARFSNRRLKIEHLRRQFLLEANDEATIPGRGPSRPDGCSVRPVASAQAGGSVRGVCKDVDGKPIVGATVRWANVENGRKYELKTNSKGEYFSLGIASGKYTATLFQDGKELFHVNGLIIELDEVVQDFDLKKEMSAAAVGQGLTPEQAKQQAETQATAAKENMTIKALNDKLSAAKQAADAGDFDTATKTLTEATTMDPSKDLLWAKLGDYTLSGAAKQTDAAAKSKAYDDAYTDYQKAIDLKQKALGAETSKSPDATKVLASYYNNMGKAAATDGKTEEAVKAYNQAAQLDPASAGMYYFNLGGTLTNANLKNDPEMRKAAVEAFDKAIAADPNKADSYYWKGTNLIGAATLQGDKMVAPPGTAEAFQKYLELAPTGPHAEEAKAMLSAVGAKVETTYGTQKKKK